MDVELQKIIDKAGKLKALHRARERVRQLERELGGASARPEETGYIPQYLRPQLPLRVTRLIPARTPPAREPVRQSPPPAKVG